MDRKDELELDQKMSAEIEKAAFKAPTEAHWYLPTGAPFHKIPYKDKKRAGELKDVTLREAREKNAARSVTSIQQVIAKKQLEIWGKNQLILAIRNSNFESLMHTLLEDEAGFPAELEKWIEGLIAAANKTREDAAKRGDQLHEALMLYSRGQTFPVKWSAHVEAVQTALAKRDINILSGQAEMSFYSSEGYGGTIDWHRRHDDGDDLKFPPVVLDYKTREKLEEKIRLAYPEKAMQLAAYRRAIKLPDADCYNVFVDLEANVCVHHWDEPTLRREEKKFLLLNQYVHVNDRYWPTEAGRIYRTWEKPIK